MEIVGLHFFGGELFPVFFCCFFLGFDGFHWYLQRFAAKLSDLHVVVVFCFCCCCVVVWLW